MRVRKESSQITIWYEIAALKPDITLPLNTDFSSLASCVCVFLKKYPPKYIYEEDTIYIFKCGTA